MNELSKRFTWTINHQLMVEHLASNKTKINHIINLMNIYQDLEHDKNLNKILKRYGYGSKKQLLKLFDIQVKKIKKKANNMFVELHTDCSVCGYSPEICICFCKTCKQTQDNCLCLNCFCISCLDF